MEQTQNRVQWRDSDSGAELWVLVPRRWYFTDRQQEPNRILLVLHLGASLDQ
jgi:hypothetical protein